MDNNQSDSLENPEWFSARETDTKPPLGRFHAVAGRNRNGLNWRVHFAISSFDLGMAGSAVINAWQVADIPSRSELKMTLLKGASRLEFRIEFAYDPPMDRVAGLDDDKNRAVATMNNLCSELVKAGYSSVDSLENINSQ